VARSPKYGNLLRRTRLYMNLKLKPISVIRQVRIFSPLELLSRNDISFLHPTPAD
jgi:hypothetical protein